MMRKQTIILIILIISIIFTLLTCDLLNRPMTLILPNALFAGDSTLYKADGVIKIDDYEETDTIIKLEIVPADEDSASNNNDDTDDLTKILVVPSTVTIPEDELSVTFSCEAEESDILGGGSKDVTIRATALHYTDAEDTITIHDASSSKIHLLLQQ